MAFPVQDDSEVSDSNQLKTVENSSQRLFRPKRYFFLLFFWEARNVKSTNLRRSSLPDPRFTERKEGVISEALVSLEDVW
jgi:hypothetical protein